jgi:hypothetical protein
MRIIKKSYVIQCENIDLLKPTIPEVVQKSSDKNNSKGCCGHRIKYSRLRVVNTPFDSSKFRWKYPGMRGDR